MANELQGRKVAILLAPVGTEQVEFTEPKKAVEDAGAEVDVVGIQTGEAQTMNSDVNPGETFNVEKTFSDVSPGEAGRRDLSRAVDAGGGRRGQGPYADLLPDPSDRHS